MEPIHTILSGSGAFTEYFVTSLVLLGVFVTLYNWITPYHEMRLIRAGNKAAAISLSGAIIGFVIPVEKAISQSVGLEDMLIWAAIAFVAQTLACGVATLLVPHFRKSIVDDHVASGVLLAALAVAIGLLNAASMTA